jgi:molybdopterin/thiamine biosynthesis adenylyltransferase
MRATRIESGGISVWVQCSFSRCPLPHASQGSFEGSVEMSCGHLPCSNLLPKTLHCRLSAEALKISTTKPLLHG